MPFSGFQAAAFGQSQLYVNHLKIFSRFRVASTVGERVGGNGCNRGTGTVVLTEKKKKAQPRSLELCFIWWTKLRI